jgi:hypothetical protein
MIKRVAAQGANTAVSGPDYFGYGYREIAELIAQLPNADKCVRYQGVDSQRWSLLEVTPSFLPTLFLFPSTLRLSSLPRLSLIHPSSLPRPSLVPPSSLPRPSLIPLSSLLVPPSSLCPVPSSPPLTHVLEKRQKKE